MPRAGSPGGEKGKFYFVHSEEYAGSQIDMRQPLLREKNQKKKLSVAKSGGEYSGQGRAGGSKN